MLTCGGTGGLCSSFVPPQLASGTKETMSFIDGEHDFYINRGQFSNTHNITNNFNTHLVSIDRAIDILHKARAVEATHTGTTASYAPKCKLGTRVEIIDDIMNWVDAAPSQTSMLWFPGPAGAGKTCIMREVVNRCEEAGLPTASYLFSTRVPGLDVERPFVATIAHQLSTNNSAVKTVILKTICDNPTVFSESLDLQIKKLIIEPMQASLPKASSSKKFAVVVDGFDECRKPTERRHLLHLLRTLVDKLPGTALIVLASRPELDIRTAFDASQFKPITEIIRLEDYDGKPDVRHFICDEFARIRENHPMKDVIPEDWPDEQLVIRVVIKSSGHFIYPATLMKYVDNPRRNPVDLLERALDMLPALSEEHPLAELDALYTVILHPHDTDVKLMKRVLHCMIGIEADDVSKAHRSPSFLDQFLSLRAGTVNIIFCDLHSVLSIPANYSSTDLIRLHHKSLEDYLVSRARSLDLFVPPHKVQIDITLACVNHLQTWATNLNNDLTEPTKYAMRFFNHHLVRCFEDKSVTISLPNAILQFDPRII